MITFAPRRTEEDDPCSGIPPSVTPDAGFLIANEVILIVSLVYWVLTLLWAARYRTSRTFYGTAGAMGARPFFLVLVLFLSCVIASIAVPGRHLFPFLQNSCRAYYILLISIAPIFASVYTLRLLILIAEASRVALSHALSMEDLAELAVRDRNSNFWHFCKGMIQLPSTAIAINQRNFSTVPGIEHQNSLVPTQAPTKTITPVMGSFSSVASSITPMKLSSEVNPQLKALAGARVIRRHYLIIVFFVMLIPAIVATAILFTTADIFIGNCANCSIHAEFLIVFVASVSFSSLIGGILMYKLRNYPDYQGTWYELKLVLFSTSFFCLLSVILIIIDPDNLEANLQVQWEWITYLSVVLSWTVSVVYQTYLARSEFTEMSTLLSSTEWVPDLNEALEIDEETCAEWIFYVREAMIDETWRFMKEIDDYKRKCPSITDENKISRATNIVNTFIIQHSPLEVNIDSGSKKALERAVAESFIGYDMLTIFDKAYAEVRRMIIDDGWKRFLAKHPETVERLKKKKLLLGSAPGTITTHSSFYIKRPKSKQDVKSDAEV